VIYCLSLSNTLHADLSDIVLRKLREDVARYPIEKSKGFYRKYAHLAK
jgi:hypothetical protein